jgi:predicted permease
LSYGTPTLWLPIDQQPYFAKGVRLDDFSDSAISVMMSARLQPGLSPAAAEAELRSLAAELHHLHPKDVWENQTLPSKPGGFANSIRHEMIPALALTAILGLLILAAACGNLGSLLLARSVAREHEISIRVAVGAGRARLVRQLFTESLLLALLGSVAALILGSIVVRLLMAWAGLPPWLDASPDWRVVTFAAATGFLAAILFGLTPAWHGARQRYRGTRTRQFLIGAQVAASCILLIVAALLVRALDRAMFAPLGFDPRQVISIDPHFHAQSPDEARLWLDTFEARLRTYPGIEAASIVSNPPLGNRWTFDKALIAGRELRVHYNHIDPPFFRTMQIPLLRGRNLARGDTREVVIGESLARLEWPAEDPIGKPLRIGDSRFVVVGVVGSARLVSPEDSDAVEVYQLAEGDIMPSMVVLVRTSGPPEGAMPAVASIAKGIDPNLFPELQLMKSAYSDKLKNAQYSALAVAVLGLIALLLACAGIVGLVAYAVSQRTREIGIRMALGAKPAHVISVLLRQFSLPVVIGALAGVAGAAALSRILRQLLYGVDNLDPLAYLAAIAIFAATVALAALWPARRALRVDPMRSLRHE